MNLNKATEFKNRFENMGFKTTINYDPDFPSTTTVRIILKEGNVIEFYHESHAGMKLWYLESWFKNFDRKTFNKIVGL
jgi:hypothetical protein